MNCLSPSILSADFSKLGEEIKTVDVVVGDKTYHGIADVGCKPTIEGVNPVAVETNIFDFNENLYGKKVRVCFRSRERSEMKFESLEALKQQLEQDIAYGRYYVQQH